MGERVSPRRHAVYERALQAWPRLAQRLIGPQPLTLIHGDAHHWNCLHPKDPRQHPAYLIDLGTCRLRPAPNDLAYMMGVMWFPDVRDRWERDLLGHYHEALQRFGVRAYSWEMLLADYRFGLMVHLFTPVIQASGGVIPATTWWYSMERIWAAFEDWEGEDMVG